VGLWHLPNSLGSPRFSPMHSSSICRSIFNPLNLHQLGCGSWS
jgi:hypothetical protein